jgi:hypothetical protein
MKLQWRLLLVLPFVDVSTRQTRELPPKIEFNELKGQAICQYGVCSIHPDWSKREQPAICQGNESLVLHQQTAAKYVQLALWRSFMADHPWCMLDRRLT